MDNPAPQQDLVLVYVSDLLNQAVVFPLALLSDKKKKKEKKKGLDYAEIIILSKSIFLFLLKKSLVYKALFPLGTKAAPLRDWLSCLI